MKKIFQISIFSAIAVMIIACGMGPSPKNAAERFLTSFNERDFEEARKYATPETNKLVDLMENLTNMAPSSDSMDVISPGKIEVLEEKIDGETAVVTFKEEGSEDIQELKLKKIDGKWLVHVTKEDIAAKDITNGQNEEEGYWSDDDTLDVNVDSLMVE